jgi:hypothetical protein
MKYPKTISGCYKLNLTEFVLKASFILNDIDDIMVELIWFEDGIAKILFENGYIQQMPLRYEKAENMYIIEYDRIPHCFQIQASLAGIHDEVDMKILIDFNEVIKEGN